MFNLGRKIRRIGNLEIYLGNFPSDLWYNDAFDYCTNAGKDWRFPTIYEFDYFHKLHDMGLCNFGSFNYWAGRRSPGSLKPVFNIITGHKNYTGYTAKAAILPVRDI